MMESDKAISVCMQQSRQYPAWLLSRDPCICPSVPDWILALGSVQGLPVGCGHERGAHGRLKPTSWLFLTHLQVEELAVPPVDSLGGGVGPGHVDNVYLREKRNR